MVAKDVQLTKLKAGWKKITLKKKIGWFYLISSTLPRSQTELEVQDLVGPAVRVPGLLFSPLLSRGPLPHCFLVHSQKC